MPKHLLSSESISQRGEIAQGVMHEHWDLIGILKTGSGL